MISFLKFAHIVLVLGLLGSVFYCLVSPSIHKQYLHKNIFLLCLFAILTGTLLVLPKHFTFHTLWIKAAYMLSFSFGVGVLGLIFLTPRVPRWVLRIVYFILFFILICAVRDAVMKTAFLL